MHRTTSLSAEGLAVYLIPNPAEPAFPTLRGLAAFGCPLPVEGKILGVIERRADAPPVEHCNGRRDRLCPGRVVRGFLNERDGLPPFRSLYETENYKKVYGKSLDNLEKEWRLSLQGK
jgi:hypothetical protein